VSSISGTTVHPVVPPPVPVLPVVPPPVPPPVPEALVLPPLVLPPPVPEAPEPEALAVPMTAPAPWQAAAAQVKSPKAQRTIRRMSCDLSERRAQGARASPLSTPCAAARAGRSHRARRVG
jgi:hypothetical protein